ncbi:hypothetical protein L596_001352 [Steinernema carpocapsae]|uniref:Uncharacterized protein n=1 Tax=Steinernema carpocapsae TaxID=34508 RepID=A0A4U8ULI4_STECR|nr:hypothetical protein L596_001352 [Steinernema carpocapsae]
MQRGVVRAYEKEDKVDDDQFCLPRPFSKAESIVSSRTILVSVLRSFIGWGEGEEWNREGAVAAAVLLSPVFVLVHSSTRHTIVLTGTHATNLSPQKFGAFYAL